MVTRTAEQQLAAAVGEGQLSDGGEAASQGSAQVTGVAQRPHREAVQVNGLHQVRQQRPLQAHHAPPVQTQHTGEKLQRNRCNQVRERERNTHTHFAILSVQDMETRGFRGDAPPHF